MENIYYYVLYHFNACFSVTPLMELKPNAGSDRAWVWNTHADFADESPKPELLAIRFLNAESKWTGAELVLIVCCMLRYRSKHYCKPLLYIKHNLALHSSIS